MVESKDTAATEKLWNIFMTTLQDAVKEHIPHKTTRAKISQPWVTAEIWKLIHKRARLYKRMKKTGSEKLKAEAKNLRPIVQRQLRLSYWIYIKTASLKRMRAARLRRTSSSGAT